MAPTPPLNHYRHVHRRPMRDPNVPRPPKQPRNEKKAMERAQAKLQLKEEQARRQEARKAKKKEKKKEARRLVRQRNKAASSSEVLEPPRSHAEFGTRELDVEVTNCVQNPRNTDFVQCVHGQKDDDEDVVVVDMDVRIVEDEVVIIESSKTMRNKKSGVDSGRFGGKSVKDKVGESGQGRKTVEDVDANGLGTSELIPSENVSTDYTTYTTNPPVRMSRELSLSIRRRAQRLLITPDPPRRGPLTTYVSIWSTNKPPERCLVDIVKKFGIRQQDWTYQSSRLAMFDNGGDREHIYRVRVSRSSDLPFAGTPWTNIFSLKYIKSTRFTLYHAMPRSETLRLILLAALIDIEPNVRHQVHENRFVAAGQTDLIVKAWASEAVKTRLANALKPTVMLRIVDEIEQIKETDLEFEK